MNSGRGILSILRKLFRASRTGTSAPARTHTAPGARPTDSPGRSGSSQTREVDTSAKTSVTIDYAPNKDGDPDGGEIVWTWVPYAENDGRGKDRPVLVLGRESAHRVLAVRLTSKPHGGDADFLALGAGPWDRRGRDSWVDIDQAYSVHTLGMRREAAALDRDRFLRIAQALQRRYGWRIRGRHPR